jgi:hypothetical protein
MQVMVTDITLGAGKTTDPVPVIQFLKANGVKVMVDNTVSSGLITQVILFTDLGFIVATNCWSAYLALKCVAMYFNDNYNGLQYCFQALNGLFSVSGGLNDVINDVGNIVYEMIEKEQESK